MTIGKGGAWGSEVDRPADCSIVESDRAVVAALLDDRERTTDVLVRGGDLARTLGAVGPSDRERVNALPIDLIRVRLDDAVEDTACAHVIARSPWYRGSWWRGPVLAVMNAEFVGVHDVAPRGHPNDGRVETFLVDDHMSLRSRLAARRRLATGTHVPHPSIVTRSVRAAQWTFERDVVVFVDHEAVGRARSIEVTVVADAAVILA